jgi:hypothetical protein
MVHDRVARWAMVRARLAPGVLSARDRLKAIWVAAGLVAAEMVECEPCGDWSLGGFIGYAVSKLVALTANGDASVTLVIERARPCLAAGCLVANKSATNPLGRRRFWR